MSVLELDYTVPGAAEEDLPNWSKTGWARVLDGTDHIVLDVGQIVDTITRPIGGLTADTEYELSIRTEGFWDSSDPTTWTVTIEGESIVLELGTQVVAFTATGSTTDVVVTVSTEDVQYFGASQARVSRIAVGEGGGPTPGAIIVTGLPLSHLRDQVDIVAATGGATLATLPAYVGYTSTGLDNSQTGRLAAIEELRAIVPTFNYDQSQHRIRWRGKLYTSDGPGLQRLQRGQDHHLSIPLKDVAG